MKLHLPIPLRSALLALLASFSLVHADDDVLKKVFDDEFGSLDERTYTEDIEISILEDGVLTIGSSRTSLAGSLTTINVSGLLVMSEGTITDSVPSTGGGKAEASLIVTDNGRVSLIDNANIARSLGTGNEASATITVKDNGQFELFGLTVDIAWASNASKANATIFVEDQGVFTFSSGNIAYGNSYGTANATIIVKDYGHFIMNGVKHDSIASSNLDGSASATIIVKSEGMFDLSGGSIAYLSSGNGTANATIVVKDRGMFTLSGGFIANHSGGNGTANATIVVKDDGTFYMSGGDIGYNSRASSSIIVKDGGTFDMSGGDIAYANGKENKAEATITVENGGSFSMTGGDIAYVGRLTTTGSEAYAAITVKDGGVFTLTDSGRIAHLTGGLGSVKESKADASIIVDNGGSFTIENGGIIACAYGEDRNKANATIIVKGGSSFTMNEGGIIANSGGYATINSEASASIIVEDGGLFLMDGGYIARTSGTDNTNTAIALIMVQSGGQFVMSNGSIAYEENSVQAYANIHVSGIFDYEGGTFGNGAQFYMENEGELKMNSLNFTADVTMHGGKLVEAENYSGNIVIDVESGFAGTSIDMGGVDAARITSVKEAQPGVQITGLMAGSELTLSGSDNLLAVGVGNTNLSGGSGQALIVFNDANGTVSFGSESDSLSLMLDIQSAVLKALSEDDTFTICLTNGSISSDWQKTNFTFRDVLQYLDFEVQEVVDGGTLVIYGNTDNLFIASRDGNPGNNGRETTPDDVQGKSAVIVDEDLTVNAGEEDVTMNHVDSLGEDADLTVKGNSDEDINAEFHNENGVDTELGGDLTITNEGDGTAHMDKTGEGRFTVGGNLNVDGDLNVKEGGLTLEGEDNHVGGNVSVGEKDGTEGNLEVNGKLTVEGNVDLEDGNGSITGNGELHIGEDGSLKMGDGVDFDGPSLTVDGELDMNGQDAKLGSLGGDGTVSGDGHLDIEGGEGDFSGDLTGSGSMTVTGDETHQSFTDAEGPGWDLEVKDGGSLTLTESTFHDVEAKEDGNLEFRAKGTGAADNGGANVHLTGDLIFRNGSTTTLTFNMNADKLWTEQDALMVSVEGTIYIERKARFVLSALQDKMPAGRGGDLTNVLVMQSQNDIQVGDEFDLTDNSAAAAAAAGASEQLQHVELAGLFYIYYESATLTVQGSAMYLDAVARQSGFLEEAAKDAGGGGTAQAGGGLLDHADLNSDPTLREVGEELGDRLARGDKAGAARLMAAVAGSTVTSLGTAQREATRSELQRALGYARAQFGQGLAHKRTYDDFAVTAEKEARATISTRQSVGNEMPVHVWVEGNGGLNKLNADGDLSGYRLNTWGGTLGAAMAPSKDTLLGLALSAQYGDLQATAADSARGDLDGYYLSLFAHVQSDKWGHSLIATFGKHEATLNRTVDYGRGSYTGHGESDGTAFAAAYELSYDIALAEDGSSILQPLVSVSLVNTSMGGYSESGANGAGLIVGDQKWTTTTVALGARWLARVDDSVFGSAVHTELSAGIAQDFGDTQGSTDVALLANPGYRRSIQGAEVGSTSFRMGAGVVLPVGTATQVYMNAHADLRSNAHSWNAAAGIRLAF